MAPALEAHLRLLEVLRPHIRTYTKPEPKPQEGRRYNARPIRLDGKKYESFRACWRKLRISPITLSKWLKAGKAEYLTENRV